MQAGMTDAIKVLLQKRTPDGRSKLTSKHPGQTHFEMERLESQAGDTFLSVSSPLRCGISIANSASSSSRDDA
jgi:hypothetical protein